MITWDDFQGLNFKMRYHDGRILVDEAGYYYVYAKTCFRYAEEHDSSKEDVSNVQLFQYIYHEKHTQSVITPILLTKSGGTLQWNIAKYNMYCVEQGRGIQLSNGDGIYVNVSNAWLLDPAADGTYFGTFKISNWFASFLLLNMLMHILQPYKLFLKWPWTTEHLFLITDFWIFVQYRWLLRAYYNFEHFSIVPLKLLSTSTRKPRMDSGLCPCFYS